MKRGNISRGVLLAVCAAALIPMLIMGLISFEAAKGMLREEYVKRLGSYTLAMSGDISDFLSKSSQTVNFFLSAYVRGASDIAGLASDEPSFSGLAFLDSNGVETAYYGKPWRTDYINDLQRITQDTLENGRFTIGSIHRDARRKRMSIILSFPNESNLPAVARIKAVVGDFAMGTLAADFKNSVPKDFFTLVFTKSGFLIYSSADGLATSAGEAYRAKIDSLKKFADDKLPVSIKSGDTIGVLSVDPVMGWLLYVESSVSAINAKVSFFLSKQTKYAVYIAAMVLAFALFAGIYVSSIFARPISVMKEAALAVEEGRWDEIARIPAPHNELGELAMAFAQMADSLKIKFETIEQDRSDLEELNQLLEIRVGTSRRELKTVLDELIKKERLAAIGQMASVVSHEIRNPLAVISNAIYLIKVRLGSAAEPKILKNLDVAEQEIRQANGIIEEILDYARSRDQVRVKVDLNSYLKDILSSYPLPKNVEMLVSYEDKPLSVIIDAQEIKQVVRNILSNAVEVMPEGGKLYASIKASGTRAELSFRDTGPGIPPEVRDKIFNPFFTTKARGTGLGLAVVKKMASRNGVEVLIKSEMGKGTEMILVFNTENKNDQRSLS
jgi:signal transduction histidine kinase